MFRVLLLLLFPVLGVGDALTAEPRPHPALQILAQHCVRCHNEQDRGGGFSLEQADSLFDSEMVIAGDAQASRLSTVITPDGNGVAEMPREGQSLSEAERETIRRWIEAGAAWPQGFLIEEPSADYEWWSFRPVVRPNVPATESKWPRNPIDAFILSTQKQHGLTHSPEADRRTLIRRVTYDLTGLPPNAQQINRFIADDSPRAYERLVDRLLASPHYGERWGRHWLDVVKYADTCGYDKDKLRPNAWPYRDYVVRSFNQDKPYGRFVREQVAGDRLYPEDADGILGLGFLAAGPWDFIGHVEVPESKIDGKVARNLDRDDMVSNVINTFCSLTIQCARCHNHKFDPFTQRHYYGLQAVFAAVDRANRTYDRDPGVRAQREAFQAQRNALQIQKAKLDQTLAKAGGAERAELDQQISDLQRRTKTTRDARYGYHSQIEASPDINKWVAIDWEENIGVGQIVLHAADDDFAGIGAGFGFPHRYRVEVRGDETQGHWQTLLEVSEDQPNPGLHPVTIDVGNQSIREVKITATQLAERKNDYIFALAEVKVLNLSGANIAEGATVTSLDSIEAPARWSRKNLVDGIWPRHDEPLLIEKLSRAIARREKLLREVVPRKLREDQQKLDTQIRSIDARLNALPEPNRVYAAATQFPPQGNFHPTGGTPRPIYLLHRGNVQQPREEVDPGLLPFSSGVSVTIDAESESDRRAAVARWLTDRSHPLLWRSIVNRLWQYHFGEGIVSTPNDFGRMGSEPTHPELLDWLAVEFRDSGQSLKHLHRLMVTSSTYRQLSGSDDVNAAIDGSNRFLWRMNRRRLSAEEIHDSILWASGSLRRKMGGPGYYQFKIEKPQHSPHFQYHLFDPADPKSHRRSIYRFIVRSQPNPFMTTLDCADSSQSTPKRIETLTSLQALTLLNNRFNLLMARRFSDQLENRFNQPQQQVQFAFQRMTGREPDAVETKMLTTYLNQYGPENLCRLLFNLSEFVFVD